MTLGLRHFLLLLPVFVLAPRLAPAQARFQTRAGDRGCEEGGWSREARYCEIRETTLPPSHGAVGVDASPNGGVKVEGWDRGEIRLRAKVVASADTEEDARAIASEVRIETGATIRAEGPSSESRRRWWVSYELWVPRRSDLSLRSENGGIAIAGVDGAIEFETTNGGVNLSGLAGKVSGRTTNGGVKLQLEGTEWAGDGLEVETTNGGVNVSVPEGYNAHLETGTVNGGLRIDFPVSVQGRLNLKDGQLRRLSTDLGSGGRSIRVTTTNGGVVVSKR